MAQQNRNCQQHSFFKKLKFKNRFFLNKKWKKKKKTLLLNLLQLQKYHFQKLHKKKFVITFVEKKKKWIFFIAIIIIFYTMQEQNLYYDVQKPSKIQKMKIITKLRYLLNNNFLKKLLFFTKFYSFFMKCYQLKFFQIIIMDNYCTIL